MTGVVVVGAGLAGLRGAEALRRREPADGRLVVELRRGGQLSGAVTVNGHREYLGYRRTLAASLVEHESVPRAALAH